MSFLTKNASFIKLQEGDHLEADLRHLVRLNPKHPILTKKFFDRDKQRKEILYVLLDHATEEDILADREGKIIRINNQGKKVKVQKKKSRKPKKKGKH